MASRHLTRVGAVFEELEKASPLDELTHEKRPIGTRKPTEAKHPRRAQPLEARERDRLAHQASTSRAVASSPSALSATVLPLSRSRTAHTSPPPPFPRGETGSYRGGSSISGTL